ncbi:hypothetical protein GF413_05785 [Candidatus Micrarchaeota archaeon]|nr:hypothetical protein [Candidatus Micrarchaeota archaeon]
MSSNEPFLGDLSDPINLILIGVGPHAKRFYIPSILDMQNRYNVRFRAVVELEETSQETCAFLESKDLEIEKIFVPSFVEQMPKEIMELLNRAVKQKNLHGAIIATDPLTHKIYVEWALQNGLHILLDKPITSRANVVSEKAQALGIEEDYKDILRIYENRPQKTCLIVCAHRRYHPGISYVIERIKEACKKTGCPVTNIHSYHSDGQWRLPSEIVTQYHHSYYMGFGKASHSGYHFFDSVCRFMKAGTVSGKCPDGMRVYSSFIRPDGLLEQLTAEDYINIFGQEYREVQRYSDEQLRSLYKNYGEVDLEAVVTFLKQNIPVCNASLSLLHNGFSRRAWMRPPADLYKGNGRVKHEQHRVHIGPFMGIQVHSYQAKDEHLKSGLDDKEIGGNNHFDIVFFNNTKILGGQKPIETMNLTDLPQTSELDESRLFIEQVKEGAIVEFLSYIRGKLGIENLSSSIEDHELPVKLMSAVYLSHNLTSSGENPIVRKEIQCKGKY